MRRIASMILLVFGLALGVVWVASAWFLFACLTPAGYLILCAGQVFLEIDWGMAQGWELDCELNDRYQFNWFSFSFLRVLDFWYVDFSLWLPAATLVLLGVWGIRATRRFPAGTCSSCGYDLRGSESKRCSECGAAIEAA